MAQVFRRVYVRLVDACVDRELMEAFVRTGQTSEEAAESFVRASQRFRDRYERAVRSMWRVAHGTEPSEAAVEALVQRAVAGASVDELLAEVRAGAPDCEAALPTADAVAAGEALPDPSPADQMAVLEIMGSVKRATELYRSSRSLAANERVAEGVRLFPEVFGRDMTVPELLRLYPQLITAPDVGALLRSEQAAFARMHAALARAVHDYTLEELGQEAFVREHLASLDLGDVEGYVAARVADMVSSRGYEDMMRAAIERAVPEGQAYEADDVAEVFAALRARRVPVTATDAVSQAVVGHFAAMAKLLSDVNALYMQHLGRDLEEDEVVQFKARFRRGDTDLARITVDVRQSYEYLDVVRGMVEAAAARADLQLSSGRLFKAVQRLFEEVPDRGREAIQARIPYVLDF